MLTRNEFDPENFDYHALTSAQLQRLKGRIMADARVEQALALRAACVWLGSRLWRVTRTLRRSAATAAGYVWVSYLTWRERRAAIAQLHALSDRSLKDIGIGRAEIESVVYGRGRDETRRRGIAAACPTANVTVLRYAERKSRTADVKRAA